MIRWSLTNALSQEGYEVIAVEDGKKAIEAIRTHHFDFLIVDLIMPEKNGWEVLDIVQQTQPLPRVIIITAHASEDSQRMAREKGPWVYVEKPFIIDKIKDILKTISRGDGQH